VKGENETKRAAARSFEDLHLYQRARELTNSVYSLTRSGAFAGDYGLSDQIRRACVSIMSNVAEGFERGTKTEFIQFLYIAKGSCGEVRAQLQIALDQSYLSPQIHGSLVGLARKISGMISNFIAHLQSSDYLGAKFQRQRQEDEISAKWRAIGQAAQQANIRVQAVRRSLNPSNPSDLSPHSHPSLPSNPSPSAHSSSP
jgi:four helix bundle protein